MTKALYGVAMILGLSGCAGERTAMRAPDDRLALAFSPKTEAPLEQPAHEIPEFNNLHISIFSGISDSMVFAVPAEMRDRQRWINLTWAQQEKLPTALTLDLTDATPSTIELPDYSFPSKVKSEIVIAETRLFK